MKATVQGTIVQINDHHKDIELKTADFQKALSLFADGDKVIITITKQK